MNVTTIVRQERLKYKYKRYLLWQVWENLLFKKSQPWRPCGKAFTEFDECLQSGDWRKPHVRETDGAAQL